jgi:hypothetical protein
MADICAYAQYIASKVGKDGIAVTWNVEQITRATGARAALLTGAATNIVVGRNGLYGYHLADADLTLYDYVFTAITADATVDQQEIAAVWTLWSLSWHDILTTALTAVGSIGALFVSTLDAAISSRGTANPGDAMALTAGERTTVAGVVWTYVTRTLTSFGTLVAQIVNALGSKVVAIFPVANGGNVTTYQGDTYNNTIGRPIDWTATDWPDLTGATIRVYVGGLTFTGAVITPTGNQRVRLDLTATQTASIPTNVRRFQVVATLAGGGNATLVEARWDSRSRPTA